MKYEYAGWCLERKEQNDSRWLHIYPPSVPASNRDRWSGSKLYLTYPMGGGCGLQEFVGEIRILAYYPQLLEDDELRKRFIWALCQFQEGTDYTNYKNAWTFMFAVTSYTLKTESFQKILNLMKKHFRVHECGAFPNYQHSPNMMHVFVFNISGSNFPRRVSWDKSGDKGFIPGEKNVQEIVPIGSNDAVRLKPSRDALGRFVAAKK